MMGIKERNFQPLPEDISLEDLVPEANFYRRLQQKLDLSFVRDLVENQYASGCPSVDPEAFFRFQLAMFYEGIRSERELMCIVSDRLSVRVCFAERSCGNACSMARGDLTDQQSELLEPHLPPRKPKRAVPTPIIGVS